jgi:hypothetical protein
MPNRKSEIQIVDTHETSETRSTIGFIAEQHQLNRTVVLRVVSLPPDTLGATIALAAETDQPMDPASQRGKRKHV